MHPPERDLLIPNAKLVSEQAKDSGFIHYKVWMKVFWDKSKKTGRRKVERNQEGKVRNFGEEYLIIWGKG
jgi:hypothetical protein